MHLPSCDQHKGRPVLIRQTNISVFVKAAVNDATSRRWFGLLPSFFYSSWERKVA